MLFFQGFLDWLVEIWEFGEAFFLPYLTCLCFLFCAEVCVCLLSKDFVASIDLFSCFFVMHLGAANYNTLP